MSKVQAMIEKLSGVGGESYDGEGRHGWRNPIRMDTGAILHSLVLAKNPTAVLEIGTAYGLSGMYIASALTKGAFMHTVEFFAPVAEEAQKNFDAAELPVQVLVGDATAVVKMLTHKYDMVFLDAEKKTYFMVFKSLLEGNLLSGA